MVAVYKHTLTVSNVDLGSFTSGKIVNAISTDVDVSKTTLKILLTLHYFGNGCVLMVYCDLNNNTFKLIFKRAHWLRS